MRGSPVLASALIYVLATALIGRQVLASLGSAIAHDPGDPLLNAAILAWNATHIPWTEAWFQFPIFHPTANALTFSEHLLGLGPLASPIYWITGNAAAAYNLTLLLAFPLSGLAMYALVWRLTRQPAAAFLAGLAFAFAPYRVSHLPQIQVQMVFWAPLALLGLHEFLQVRLKPDATYGERVPGERVAGERVPGERGVRLQPDRGWRWLSLYAICWLLQGASNGYFLVYFSILVGLWVLWFVVARRRWRELALITAATAVASIPLVPILSRYLSVQRELGLSRNLGEVASYGADIAGLLCAAPTLTFWGWLHVACGPEGELFAGAALIALCVVGAITSHRAAITGHGATETPSENYSPWFRDSVARVVSVVRLVALGVAAVFLAVSVSAALAGPWSVDLGLVRASVSSVDKPLSTALAMLLIAFLLSPAFRRAVRHGSATTFYLGAAVVCWIFAWGPFPRLFGVDALYQAPFAWLLQVPGVSGLRVPARFWMMSVICLAVFLGLVVARLLPRLPRRTSAALMTVAALGLLADGWTTIPSAALPHGVPDPGALRNEVVLALPAGELYGDPGDGAAAYRAVLGGWRSINGYSGYEPGYYDALRALSRDADGALLAPFVERSDVHVLVREDAAETRSMLERQPGVALTARRDGLLQFRLRRRPASAVEPHRGQSITPIAVSSPCDSAGVPLMTDGMLETEWVCGAELQDQQLIADAGRPRVIGAIVLAFGPHAAGFPRDLVVETSNDTIDWDQAWAGSPAAAVLRAAFASPRETRVALRFDPREARYVRLRQLNGMERFWSIAELELSPGGR